jgi:hypothetical protein
MPFKPGESGNPHGTPGPKRFHAALQRAIAQDKSDRIRAAAEKLLDLASEGVPWALTFLAEKLDGKNTNIISISHDVKELSDSELSIIATTSSDGAFVSSDSSEITT